MALKEAGTDMSNCVQRAAKAVFVIITAVHCYGYCEGEANQGKSDDAVATLPFVIPNIQPAYDIALDRPPRLVLEEISNVVWARMPHSEAYSFPIDIGIGIINLKSTEPYSTVSVRVAEELTPTSTPRSGSVYLLAANGEHIIAGTLTIAAFKFESDADNPLHFKLVQGQGYRYLSGSGFVTMPDGMRKTFPRRSLEDCRRIIKSQDPLEREGACVELLNLGRQPVSKSDAARLLVSALGDQSQAVRRNAAEALGAIGDSPVKERLAAMVAKTGQDKWSKDVAREAIERINFRDLVAREISESSLKGEINKMLASEFPAVRRDVYDFLVLQGPKSVPGLIDMLNADDDVVVQSAIHALGQLGDDRAVAPLTRLKENKSYESAADGALKLITRGSQKENR